MSTRTITIVAQGDGHFDVHEGESVARGLCWDELLGEVARLTAAGQPAGRGRYMRHIDVELAWRERMRKTAEAASK